MLRQVHPGLPGFGGLVSCRLQLQRFEACTREPQATPGYF